MIVAICYIKRIRVVLAISNLTKSYGGQLLYEGGQVFIGPQDKVGLVGPNGAGKSSLFRLIVGEEKPDAGQISYANSLKISYFSQNVGEMKGKTVLNEVIETNPKMSSLRMKMREIEKKLEEGTLSDEEMEKVLEELGECQTEFEKIGGYDIEYVAAELLTGLGIMPESHNNMVETFSGGWKMRVALAKVLVERPDLILMDEPTNYLDLESIVWLESWLKDYKGAVFMTSHDRDFMNSIVNKIVEVNHKMITQYGGNYDYYEKESKIRREKLVAQFERQQEMLSKEEEFIAKFQARASHAAQVQSRVKKLEKIERIEIMPEEDTIEFEFPVPPRSGNDVVKISNLKKVYTTDNDSKLVFSNVTGVINRLDRLAVVGVNGAGKSTLLKIIAGMMDPTEGECVLGASVNMGYFSQFSLDVLNPQNTVFEEVRSRVKMDKSDGYVRNLLAAFLFRGDDVDKKVSVLSGGEKSRLILATLLTNPINLLILDEPTNHLDIKSREVLMEALKKFDGTLIMVSHDRHFIRELATRVVEISKTGVEFINGNYDYYLEKKGKA